MTGKWNFGDLILYFEDEFSIYIEDDELRRLRGMEDIYQVVIRKLDQDLDGQRSRAFYRTREVQPRTVFRGRARER